MRIMICPRCNGSGRLPSHRKLRQARIRAGLGIRELARKLGLSPSYVCLIDNGQQIPPARTAGRWLEACRYE